VNRRIKESEREAGFIGTYTKDFDASSYIASLDRLPKEIPKGPEDLEHDPVDSFEGAAEVEHMGSLNGDDAVPVSQSNPSTAFLSAAQRANQYGST